MQTTVTSEELQFQSILDAVFSSRNPDAARDPDSNQLSTALEREYQPLPGISMEELLFLNDSIKDIASELPITPFLPPASEKSPYATEEDRWQAVLDHDRAANGHFVYCVRSTGIFCRPTCPSRRPLLSNVSFYSNKEEAENAGFRPCRRCKPQDLILPSDLRQLAAVELVKKEIEEAATNGMKRPSLRYLASKAGMSSFHFHRVFKARTGLTLDEYRKLMFARKESEA
jgi:methylphosphotriester-DNA--protein-cysteine methyltransferase